MSEGDYARDVIVQIVSEHQIYEGIMMSDCVKIRVDLNCTINGQNITATRLINYRNLL